MDALAMETMSMRPVDAAQKERQRATKVADQFEAVFVQTLVSSLRQTAKIGDGGMFGAGPGADTYGDWFDQNLAQQIGESGEIGIKKQLLKDFERAGAITTIDQAAQKAHEAQRAADRHAMTAAKTRGNGGFDVVL